MVLPSVVDILAYATAAGAATGACAATGTWALRRWLPAPRPVPADPAEKAVFAALHAISETSPLRGGLTEQSAGEAARRVRMLLGAEAVALVGVLPPAAGSGGAAPGDTGTGTGGGRAAGGGTGAGADSGTGVDTGAGTRAAAGSVGAAPRLLAWDGEGHADHAAAAVGHALPVLAGGEPRVLTPASLACHDPLCGVQVATIAPLTVEGCVAGTLTAYWRHPSAARVKAAGEAARLVTGQLELAGLDTTRVRLAEAETRALRAQISPHFVYNSLTTIASFVRTDPDRARELLLDFADFARYCFRNPRDFTTLGDEVRSIDRYLLLERARFGERLKCEVEIAPEVLPVAVPFLALQPLVENAVRHGMAGTGEAVHISIVVRDSGADAAISVEDDGVGMDPERLREILAAPLGRPGPTGWGSMEPPAPPDRSDSGAGIGLANVDERMRQIYGEDYGLTVETALGSGTKVNLRVPKYRPGVFPG